MAIITQMVANILRPTTPLPITFTLACIHLACSHSCLYFFCVFFRPSIKAFLSLHVFDLRPIIFIRIWVGDYIAVSTLEEFEGWAQQPIDRIGSYLRWEPLLANAFRRMMWLSNFDLSSEMLGVFMPILVSFGWSKDILKWLRNNPVSLVIPQMVFKSRPGVCIHAVHSTVKKNNNNSFIYQHDQSKTAN